MSRRRAYDAGMDRATPPLPTLYYDGDCPVCSREIAMYRSGPGADSIRWVDASRCDAADLGSDLSRDAALGRLHWRQPDGRLVSGAAAFRSMWLALPGWAWLGRWMRSPLALASLELVYRAFLVTRRLWRPAR